MIDGDTKEQDVIQGQNLFFCSLFCVGWLIHFSLASWYVHIYWPASFHRFLFALPYIRNNNMLLLHMTPLMFRSLPVSTVLGTSWEKCKHEFEKC